MSEILEPPWTAVACRTVPPIANGATKAPTMPSMAIAFESYLIARMEDPALIRKRQITARASGRKRATEEAVKTER